jgi:hypothetical protein
MSSPPRSLSYYAASPPHHLEREGNGMMLITRYKIIRGIENDRPTASLFVKRD